ncbi:unnamed protein product [Macrosiphum euphorbiae]|uniref:Dynein heavy chain AAA 5 extension domain-containing protein n=1 Tax=Macrosiphum euphorbiae TaxID=13131 RepID=A0AAV0VJ56_9HEMI|nr:unnamed protein product [Macrosiphum euphorbiae]
MSVYGSEQMVMDGAILYPMWIESLNTVLYDNKVLTLVNNERMNVMNKQMLCTLLDCLSTPINCPLENARDVYGTYFVYTCLWAFGSALFKDQLIDWRVEFSKWWLTDFKTIKISSSGSVFNYFIDPEQFFPWLEDLVSSFEFNPDTRLQQTLVNTIDTTIIRYMLSPANDNGKSFAVENVPLNLYPISEMLQKILEKPLEKKAGRNFDLSDGKTLIHSIDDINTPEVS